MPVALTLGARHLQSINAWYAVNAKALPFQRTSSNLRQMIYEGLFEGYYNIRARARGGGFPTKMNFPFRFCQRSCRSTRR